MASLDTPSPHRTLKTIGDVAAFGPPPGFSGSICLIRPFSVHSPTTYSAPVTLPIGPAYLAAVLERAGWRVGMIDAVGADIYRVRRSACGRANIQGLGVEEIVERIPEDAAIIGVSLMFSQEWPLHRELIRAIAAAHPRAVIVVGGEHVSALTEYVLRDTPEIAFAVVGEGELVFLELVHAIAAGTPNLPAGVCRINRLGEFESSIGPRLAQLDDLPRPAWHLLPVENYFIDNWTMGIAMGRNIPILATRGCPYRCTFCSNATMWTTRYTMRSVSDVVDEIAWLVETYQANSIDFFDLTAIVKKDWVLEFCRELSRRGLSITWQLPSGTRSEALDDEVLAAIREAGCHYLVYAPESGSTRTLEAIKKKIKLPRLTTSIRAGVRMGHTVKVNLIIGFPTERLGDVLRTLAYAVRVAILGAHDCNISVFSAYPGSELYRELRAQGRIPPPDDAYFFSLMGQFDLMRPVTFCDNVPGLAISATRILGHALFYGISYTLRPARIVRVIRRMLSGKFRASNLFEQRIFDLIRRRAVEEPGGETRLK